MAFGVTVLIAATLGAVIFATSRIVAGNALADAARHAGPIHLLLSDVMMPGMNGRELWEQLADIRREAKVLFMSGYTDDAVFRLGISDLGLPYLQKPFTAQSLAAAVSGALADGQAGAL